MHKIVRIIMKKVKQKGNVFDLKNKFSHVGNDYIFVMSTTYVETFLRYQTNDNDPEEKSNRSDQNPQSPPSSTKSSQLQLFFVCKCKFSTHTIFGSKGGNFRHQFIPEACFRPTCIIFNHLQWPSKFHIIRTIFINHWPNYTMYRFDSGISETENIQFSFVHSLCYSIYPNFAKLVKN
ncbi:hypothetical protein T4B_7479 [Trichinella pseudospiralis]|uniref:Uncharacterized protein n=1 Tax=Trichinella pseudospiralis TaxID=6337 RepID=A0A0V1ILE2_TRIPS|nr:hypothetical protein T4B_7479 [Trichinella pseudospiralis]